MCKTSESYRFKKSKILLVEDDPLIQEVVIELLRAVNLDVAIANNGEEAIAQLQKNVFHLVLMDVHMPIMDGLTATKKIRSLDGDVKSIPIIAMTANDSNDDLKKSTIAGMNHHVIKPVSTTILFPILSKYLPFTFSDAHPFKNEGKYMSDIEGVKLEDGLARVNHNWDSFKKILLLFCENAKGVDKKIINALEHDLFLDAMRYAHTMKGSCASIGAYKVSKIAADLELAIQRRESKSIEASLQAFTEGIHGLLSQLSILSVADMDIEISYPEYVSRLENPQEVMILIELALRDLLVDYGKVEIILKNIITHAAGTEFEHAARNAGKYFYSFDYTGSKRELESLHRLIGEAKNHG